MSGFGFEIALAAIKLGAHARRRGWNGKGMHVELQVPDKNSKMTKPYIFLAYPKPDSEKLEVEGHVMHRVPWIASQTDLLADDWQYLVPGFESGGWALAERERERGMSAHAIAHNEMDRMLRGDR